MVDGIGVDGVSIVPLNPDEFDVEALEQVARWAHEARYLHAVVALLPDDAVHLGPPEAVGRLSRLAAFVADGAELEVETDRTAYCARRRGAVSMAMELGRRDGAADIAELILRGLPAAPAATQRFKRGLPK